MSKKSDFMEYTEVVKRIFEREKKEFQEKLDYWNSKKGHKVKHVVYLLIGTITGTIVVPVSSQPLILVKWNNGAESSEHPVNIRLMVFRRKRK